MANYKRPSNKAEFQENFAQIKPSMNATMAYYESSRCLFCYDAPCVQACPTEIDIPLFIKQINTGNTTGAAKTIYDSNYFGYICGKVCPTEVLCEGACVFNEQGIKPIEIGRLQSYATSSGVRKSGSLFSTDPSLNKKIAVIGAGPAGLSCACELRNFGYQVDVYEANSKPSGLALHGTAPYKITNSEVLDEVAYLQAQFGFEIHYNKLIARKNDIDFLEKGYDAIFVGLGLGSTRPTRIEGETLENCLGATEFIESIKVQPLKTQVGKIVIIIGGGNTAMDAASEAARMGAEQVILLYRRSRSKMRAYDFELDLAKSVGVKAIFNTQVIQIIGNQKVEALKCIKTEQQNGRLEHVPGSEFSIACDMLIFATGQKKQTGLLDLIGLKYNSNGTISVDPNNFQCSNPMYFAGGDAVNGGREVVHACAEGKRAAIGIHEYLG